MVGDATFPENDSMTEVRRLTLNEQRLAAVTRVVLATDSKRILDIGCGEGKLMERLLAEPSIEQVVGLDASLPVIERASLRLGLNEAVTNEQRRRVSLVHDDLTSPAAHLVGFDAAVAVEVIEHLEADRLTAFEIAIFERAAPRLVVVTTPNREYNVHIELLQADGLRHQDHRFEWTRAEFAQWTKKVAAHRQYEVTVSGIGDDRGQSGAPTQMAVFQR